MTTVSYGYSERRVDIADLVTGSVGPGWVEPVVECLRVLYAAGATIEQVKQKFAGLRVNYFYPEDNLWAAIACEMAIRRAERACSFRCEECGAPGKVVRPRWWMYVACPEHEDWGDS